MQFVGQVVYTLYALICKMMFCVRDQHKIVHKFEVEEKYYTIFKIQKSAECICSPLTPPTRTLL